MFFSHIEEITNLSQNRTLLHGPHGGRQQGGQAGHEARHTQRGGAQARDWSISSCRVIILTSYWLRRRRDNINNWIMKLSKLLPECGGANTIPGPGDLHSPGGAAKVSCHWWRGTALDPDWSRRRSPRAGSWRRRASTWRRCGTRTSGWWTASSRPRRSRRTTSVFHHKLNSYR